MVDGFLYFYDLNLQKITHEGREILRELVSDGVFPFGCRCEIINVLSYFLDQPLLHETRDDSLGACLAHIQDNSHFLLYRTKGPQDESPVQVGKKAFLEDFSHEWDSMLGK